MNSLHRKKYKVILLGLTGSGKSTIGLALKNQYHLPVLEVDDEVLKLNKGKWPDNEDILDTLFEQTNEQILDMDNVIFITSFLKKERIFEFAYRGFVIIELHATLNGLIRRKRKRDTPGDRFIDQLRENFKYYFQVVDDLALNALFSLRLDMTHLSTNEALKRIIDTISYQDAKSHLTEDGKLYVVTVSRLREFIKRHFQGIFGNYTKLVQGKTHTVALAQH